MKIKVVLVFSVVNSSLFGQTTINFGLGFGNSFLKFEDKPEYKLVRHTKILNPSMQVHLNSQIHKYIIEINFNKNYVYYSEINTNRNIGASELYKAEYIAKLNSWSILIGGYLRQIKKIQFGYLTGVEFSKFKYISYIPSTLTKASSKREFTSDTLQLSSGIQQQFRFTYNMNKRISISFNTYIYTNIKQFKEFEDEIPVVNFSRFKVTPALIFSCSTINK